MSARIRLRRLQRVTAIEARTNQPSRTILISPVSVISTFPFVDLR
jgi:hypothetical protein